MRILNFLFGSFSSSILEIIKIKENAKNDEDRIKADLILEDLRNSYRLKAEAVAFRKSTRNFIELRFLTFFIALPFAMHSFAVNLDSIFLFEWNVARLPEPYADYQGQIILWFFGLQATTTAINSIASIFRRK